LGGAKKRNTGKQFNRKRSAKGSRSSRLEQKKSLGKDGKRGGGKKKKKTLGMGNKTTTQALRKRCKGD